MEPREDQHHCCSNTCGHGQTVASPEQRTYLPWGLVPGLLLFTNADLAMENILTMILTFYSFFFFPPSLLL